MFRLGVYVVVTFHVSLIRLFRPSNHDKWLIVFFDKSELTSQICHLLVVSVFVARPQCFVLSQKLSDSTVTISKYSRGHTMSRSTLLLNTFLALLVLVSILLIFVHNMWLAQYSKGIMPKGDTDVRLV